MGTLIILLLFIAVPLVLTAGYDSKHLQRRTYVHRTQQLRDFTNH
ncbi:MAG TPA: hypothetical protein VHZ51_08345 [Ktedonobacteraceae bacterium]|nr:hypothetical protein [Ktedonobacteraceae bacterium]